MNKNRSITNISIAVTITSILFSVGFSFYYLGFTITLTITLSLCAYLVSLFVFLGEFGIKKGFFIHVLSIISGILVAILLIKWTVITLAIIAFFICVLVIARILMDMFEE